MDILYIWEYKIINMKYAPTSHNQFVDFLNFGNKFPPGELFADILM